MFMPLCATGELVLPALSVHVPDDDVWPAPSVLTVTGLVQLSIPDRESLPLKVTVTFVLFQPLALAAGEAAAVAVGTVLSTFIPLFVTGALVFPALSVHVPGDDVWPEPSMLITTGLVQVSMPDRESLPLNVTVTSVLFQPLALGAGKAAADAVGTVLSIFTTGEVKVALLPAKSVTVTVPVTAAPSVESTKGLAAGLVEPTPDSGSTGVNENETSLLFHPFPLAAGLAAPNVRVGAVASRL